MKKKLIQFRQKNNISQEALAKYLGISQVALSHIEKGKRYLSPEKALKLEEYTKQINPNDYIKATELINPKKLKEFELIAKVRK
jgi:transcriptional regulator with XRE-family HTH domain